MVDQHCPAALQMAMRCIARTCLEKLEERHHNAEAVTELLMDAANKHAELGVIVPNYTPSRFDLNREFNALGYGNAYPTNGRRSRSRSRSR
jgi:hypothetical protein